MAFFTKAGEKYANDLTAWLQDTRLMSKPVKRLFTDYQSKGTILFSPASRLYQSETAAGKLVIQASPPL
jgi:hypothetical protein